VACEPVLPSPDSPGHGFSDRLPRTIATAKAKWLNATSCPGHGTCTGFNPVNYQILTSPNGSQNSGTVCATVTANASFTTTDACAASTAPYVE
jgi:hypothetical protein